MSESSAPESEAQTSTAQIIEQKKTAKFSAFGLGAAVAAIPPLLRVFRTHEQLSRPTDSRNIFIPASHWMGEEVDTIQKAFDNGDPDAHVWNPDKTLVAEIASFAPEVITLDAASANTFYEPANKNWRWINLPARPQKINPKGVYAIAGDVSYKSFDPSKSPNADTPMGAKMEAEFQKDKAASANDFISEVCLMGGAIIAAQLFHLHRDGLEKQIKTGKSPRQWSRREFLAKSVAAGGGALLTTQLDQIGKLLGAIIPPSMADSSPLKQRELAMKLNAYLQPGFSDVWLDGRTALLIAKHEDAMEYLKKYGYISPETAKGAIVMGFAHVDKSALFMHDKKARNEAIARYAQHVIGLAYKFVDENYTISEDERGRLDDYLRFTFAATEINHITDPGISPGQNLQDYIKHNVQFLTTIRSPQVMKIIQDALPSKN